MAYLIRCSVGSILFDEEPKSRKITSVTMRIEPVNALPENFQQFQQEIGAGMGVLYGRQAELFFHARARQALTDQLHQDDMLAWAALSSRGDTLGLLFVILDGCLARVTLLHVLADSRDENIACLLMVHAIEVLRGAGVESILYDTAGADAPNLEALALRHGFIKCPRRLMRLEGAAILEQERRHNAAGECLPPERIAEAAACMVRAYENHPDRILYHELRVHQEACLFLRRVMAGAYGQVSPHWIRAAWDGPQCAGGIVACRVFPGTLFILQLFTHPEYRGQGIATGLIADIAQEARQGGADTQLFLGVSENNPAVALYSRLGFRPIHRTNAYVWRR